MSATSTVSKDVVVARTEQQIEPLRPFWEQWKSHPTAEWNACRALAAISGGTTRTIAVIDGDPAAPRAALVAMEQDASVPVTLGYWRIANPRVRILTVKHGGGWLGPATEASARAIFAALQAEMLSCGATMLHLEHFPVDHPLVAAATAAGAKPVRAEPDVNWRVAIPENYAAFLAACSKNTRRNLKRYPERFLEEFGARATVHVFDRPADFDRIVADMDLVAQHSYHRGMGVGFLKAPEQLALMQAALAQGTYRAYLLHIDGAPAAFWDGRRCGATFYTDFTGYLPKYGEARPGWYLLSKVVEDLCRDPDVEYVDFGQGDAQYKRMLGTLSEQQTSVAMFASTFRGRSLRALVRTTAGSTKLVRRMLDKVGLTDRVKKLWRRRLAEEQKPEQKPESGE